MLRFSVPAVTEVVAPLPLRAWTTGVVPLLNARVPLLTIEVFDRAAVLPSI